jgi:hypothetical protein
MKSSKGGSGFMMKRRRSSSMKLRIVIPLFIARSREGGNSPTENMWKKRKRFLLDVMKKGIRSTTVEHQR